MKNDEIEYQQQLFVIKTVRKFINNSCTIRSFDWEGNNTLLIQVDVQEPVSNDLYVGSHFQISKQDGNILKITVFLGNKCVSYAAAHGILSSCLMELN